ncbi:hypothetical protein NC651_006758 [Populus alba x Populus x berolinensis]|nr:hypothetical protein NC651_006758 [Populus alba x Populus x berolinensis]
MIIKVKPQAKRAKVDRGNVKEHLEIGKTSNANMEKSSDTTKGNNDVSKTDLVSQSDESEDDEFHFLCSSFLHTSSRGSR